MKIKQDHSPTPSFSRCVRAVRSWEDEYLPLSQSRIAFDLFVLIASSVEDSNPLTLKELMHSLNYSQRGVRYVLAQFVADGWCEINGHQADKRFRLVTATNKLVAAFEAYKLYALTVYNSLDRTVT